MNLAGLASFVPSANRGLGHAFLTELLSPGFGRVVTAVPCDE